MKIEAENTYPENGQSGNSRTQDIGIRSEDGMEQGTDIWDENRAVLDAGARNEVRPVPDAGARDEVRSVPDAGARDEARPVPDAGAAQALLPETLDFDTKTLSYIIAIVDEGGLSRAAEKLYLSQPALSRYLRGVEAALGTPIFNRSHNRLTLTNAGKVFINGARSMLRIEADVRDRLRVSRLDRRTALSVAAQPLFFPFLRETVQPELVSACPEMRLELTEASADEVRRLVSNASVDLGFFMGAAAESPYFFQECMMTSRLVFCAAKDSPALMRCRENGFHLREFADEPMMMSLENTFLSQIQHRLLQESGITAPRLCARGRLTVLADLVRLGYGNVTLPLETPGLPLTRCFFFTPPETYSCLAAWSRERPLSQPARQFLNLAQERFPEFARSVA